MYLAMKFNLFSSTDNELIEFRTATCLCSEIGIPITDIEVLDTKINAHGYMPADVDFPVLS